MSGPMDSRRKTYWPPARGNMAASSPYASAPSSVMMPVRIHATSRNQGDPTVREMSAETMKIPEPIIEPATSIVASVRVIALTNSDCGCDGATSVGAVTLVIKLQVSGGGRHDNAGCAWPALERQKYTSGSGLPPPASTGRQPPVLSCGWAYRPAWFRRENGSREARRRGGDCSRDRASH